MTDDELPQAIRDYNFATNDKGAPILPPRTNPLGKRLQHALPDRFGEVSWELKPAAQAALREKHFALVTSPTGKTGLHPDTPRAGGRHQKPMTDIELAQAVRNHNFATNDKGVPILPPQTTRLGERLRNALVNKGHVNSALQSEAQAALWEKRFALVTSTDGRRVGLHPSTLRTGGTRQPQARGPLVPAAAGPVAGGSRQHTGQTISLPRMKELDEPLDEEYPPSLAAVAAEPVPGWSRQHTGQSISLPRIPQLRPRETQPARRP